MMDLQIKFSSMKNCIQYLYGTSEFYMVANGVRFVLAIFCNKCLLNFICQQKLLQLKSTRKDIRYKLEN